MSDNSLRSGLIRLAYANPDLRSALLPLIKKHANSMNPASKRVASGPDAEGQNWGKSGVRNWKWKGGSGEPSFIIIEEVRKSKEPQFIMRIDLRDIDGRFLVTNMRKVGENPTEWFKRASEIYKDFLKEGASLDFSKMPEKWTDSP